MKKSVLLDTYCLDKPKSINSLFMHSFYAVADIGKGAEILKLYVEEMNIPNIDGTSKRAYQLQYIEKAFAASVKVQGNAYSSLTNTANVINNVSDLFSLVKRYDKNFNPKPVNPVMLNNDGTPKVLYHGTGSDFNIFDLQKSGSRFGEVSEGLFFFTNKKSGYPDSATDYANGTKENGGTPRVMEVYLSIKNPLKLDSKGYYTPVAYFDEKAEEVYDKYLSGDYDGIVIENSDKSADDSVSLHLLQSCSL